MASNSISNTYSEAGQASSTGATRQFLTLDVDAVIAQRLSVRGLALAEDFIFEQGAVRHVAAVINEQDEDKIKLYEVKEGNCLKNPFEHT